MATTAINTTGRVRNQSSRSLLPIFSRIVTVPPIIIMVLIGFRFIADPIHAVAATGVALNTPEAITDTRVTGGLAFTLAFMLLTFLFSRGTARIANATVVTLMGLVLAVRTFGFAIDGTTLAMGGQKTKFTGELVFLVLNSLAFSLQTFFTNRNEVQQ
jgi:hypothetical protein